VDQLISLGAHPGKSRILLDEMFEKGSVQLPEGLRAFNCAPVKDPQIAVRHEIATRLRHKLKKMAKEALERKDTAAEEQPGQPCAGLRGLLVAGDNPRAVRLFVGIVKKRLWGYITDAQRERAARAIKHYEEKHPEAFDFSFNSPRKSFNTGKKIQVLMEKLSVSVDMPFAKQVTGTCYTGLQVSI